MSDAEPTLPTYETTDLGPSHAATELQSCVTVIFHPELRRVGERAFVRPVAGATFDVSRTEPRFAQPSGSEPRALDDPYLSRESIRIRRTADGLALEVPSGSKVRIGGEPAPPSIRLDRDRLDAGLVLELAGRVALLVHRAAPGVAPDDHGMLGASAPLRAVQRAISGAADLDVPVLIRGETGVGKDRVARATHEASGARGDYVAVNMATIARATAASELFGHAKGAFTGAAGAHSGLFGRADGGTLFLDEIGEVGLDVQGMLLRTIETNTVRALGAVAERPCRARVLAATDADLDAMVDAGVFRSALLHRLSALEVRVPPLRERREDIPRFAVAFLEEELAGLGGSEALRLAAPEDRPWLPLKVMLRLLDYPWPGNIRQLRNVIRAIVVANRDAPEVRLDPRVEEMFSASASSSEVEASDRAPDTERLLAVLEQRAWSFSAGARDLGLSRAAFYRLVAACPQIRTGADLSREELVASLNAKAGDLDAMSADLRVSRRAIQRRMKALGLS